MAAASEQDIFISVFGSGFETYSWWIDTHMIRGNNSADYFEPYDGWVIRVVVEDPENDEGAITKRVTAQDIKSACHKIMRDGMIGRSLREDAKNLLFDVDELDLDAPAADAIMQYVMFDGEIVYG